MIERLSSQNVSLTSRTVSTGGNSVVNQKPDEIHQEMKVQKPNNQEPQTKEQITEVINGMNKFLQPSHTSLKFVLHEKLNEYYVTVIDDTTQEVVKEIPSKKLLDVYAAMTEFLGLLVDKKI
jgi:flagellar protein FlaG